MTHYFQKAIFGLFFLLCFYNANSKILKVETLANSGVGSLRDQIIAASTNDTILINIKGTILITGSSIVINKNLTIVGVTASHTTIDLNSNWFDINMAGGNVKFIDMRITNFAGSLNAPVMINGGQTVSFINVLFEGMGTSVNGGAIQLLGNGILNLENCSFFNNSTNNNGGALYIDNAATANIRNCTFFQNFTNGAGVGGAICNNGNVVLVNNTFLNNTSGSAIGHAVADNNTSAGSNTRIQNNIFTDATVPKYPDLLEGNLLNMWQTDGGNIIPSSNLILDFIPGTGTNDRFSEPFSNLFLRPTVLTDGYGLKYYTITSQTSTAIDNGTGGVNVSFTDCRRAPRVIFGDNVLASDAGAVEYTPFTITLNNSAGFNSTWNAMNSSSFAGPKYMDFDISGGGPVNYNLSTTLNNFTSGGIDWIIDGFTQDGSVVPGPGNTPNSFTPAVYMVNIQNSSSDNISLVNPGLNSFISGLSISNPNTVGIQVDGGQIHIYGNKIIAAGPLGSDAIYLTSNNNALIGGEFHYCRNVLGNQTNAGIHAFNNVTDISGNFIGCNEIATTDQSSDKGVFARGAICNIRGKIGLPSMNIISGNNTAQVDIQNGLFLIRGNIIGPDFTMNTLMGPCQYGIHAEINTDGEIGGVSPGSMNVIGGNSTGILLQGCNAANVFGNFIGISPDGSSSFPSIPNSTGISIYTNGDANHFIGNGSIQARNYICNNSSMGIYMEEVQGHTIMGNFIGIKPDNTTAGNGTRGIHLTGLGTEGNDILGNIIGGHSVAGIDVNGTAGSGNISGNKIGTDSTGMVARPNGRGIQVAATGPNSQIIGNLISGNTNEGIHLDNSYHAIDGNIIGINMDTTLALPNGGDGITLLNTNNCNITDNYIGSNGANGILLMASNANSIRGNHIGTNRIGMDFGNQQDGITLFFVSANNMIGGNSPSDPNSIMFNVGAGISVERETSITGIRGNHFFQNGAHAISLNPAVGVGIPLANDINDADIAGPAGPNVGNNGQNTPNVTSAVFNAGTCTVSGTMNVDNVSANYLIQIYKVNPGNIDPTGHGEGDTLIAEQTFNAAGLNTFNFTMSISGPVLGDILSATTSKVVSVNYETSEFSDTILVRAPFDASIIDSTDVLCNGAANGRVEVSATGSSNLPYTYQWHDGGGPIAGANASVYNGGPGTYFCVVTDATPLSVNSDTVTIIEPPLLLVTPSSTNTLCSASCDGTITLIETGGTSPYQYSINNGSSYQPTNIFTGLCAGTYQFLVQDANGCTTSNTGNNIIINNPPALSMTPTFTPETCSGMNDGTITVTPFGGTGPYTYQIDGGGYGPGTFFGGLAPGNHIVDILDANSCTSNILVNIVAGDLVTANFTTSFGTACEDLFDFDFTDISTSSTGSITSWNWNIPGGSPSGATIPNVTNVMFFTPGINNVTLDVVSSNGCTSTITLPITVFENPIVNAGADASICVGDAFTQNASITQGTPALPYAISWTPAGNFISNTIEDPTISALASGTYTHTMNVSDANGCAGTDFMTLTVNSLPIVNAGTDSPVCQGSLYTLTGSGSASTYVWDNTVVDGTPFVFSATTTYTVIGTDVNGCQASDQVILTADIPYTISAGSDFNVCESSSAFTLSGTTNAPTYSWIQLNGTGALSGSTTLNPTYTIAAPDTIQTSLEFIFQTPVSGTCPASDDTVSVFLIEPPTVSTFNDFAICSSSSSLSLVATPTNTSGVIWTTSGTGSFTPTNTTPTTNYVLSPGDISFGSVNLSVTATATNGVCANASDAVLITILTSPTANAGADASICNGQTYTLDATGSTGTIATYSWDEVFGPNIGTNSTENVSPILTATYAITVDNGTCSDSDTMTLTVNVSPDPTFNYSNTSFCINSPDELPTFVATAGGTFSLPLSPGSINSTTGNINFTTLSPGVYSVIYSLTIPCLASDTIALTIFALPTVNAGNDTSFCAGGTVALNGTGSGSNFNWSSVNGFNTNTNPTSDTPASTDTYTLTVLDANGCYNTDTKVVTVNPIPTGTITGGGAFCEGDPSASLIVTANGYSGGGDWNNQFFQNSSPGAIATPPAGTYTISGMGNSANNGVWTAVITDNITGCVGNATGSVSIFVNPEPAMSVSSPFNVCSSVATFDMNTFLGPTIGGGTWAGSGVTGVNFNPFSIGPGVFNVIYTVSTGCDDTIQINVQASPNPTISGLNSAYCITDAPFMPTGTPVGGLWSLDGATFTSITSIDPSTLTTGTHTLSYQFTDGVTGCVGATNPNAFVISPVPLDPTAVSNTNQSICGGASLLLTVSNPNTGGTTIQWYSDAALTINVGSTINFTTPVLTSSIVYYAVAQNAGCKSNPVIFTITVNNPLVSAGADLTICPGTPAQLNLTSVSGTISWSPGISLNDSTIQNPLATPNVSTTYVVTVTSGPCSSQDSVNVIIDGSNPDCGIKPSYNAFSPDGDGINDDWIIDAILAHPDNRVTIYNRWGDKLVSFDDYDNVNVVWDGMYKGEILPSGTYFYVIEYLDIQMQVSGWLQLTR